MEDRKAWHAHVFQIERGRRAYLEAADDARHDAHHALLRTAPRGRNCIIHARTNGKDGEAGE